MTPTLESRRFVLKFNSNVGRVLRISIPRSIANKSAADTESAMDAIIATNAVYVTNAGSPQSVKAAKIVTVERRELV